MHAYERTQGGSYPPVVEKSSVKLAFKSFFFLSPCFEYAEVNKAYRGYSAYGSLMHQKSLLGKQEVAFCGFSLPLICSCRLMCLAVLPLAVTHIASHANADSVLSKLARVNKCPGSFLPYVA